jgi:hypothetical protein
LGVSKEPLGLGLRLGEMGVGRLLGARQHLDGLGVVILGGQPACPGSDGRSVRLLRRLRRLLSLEQLLPGLSQLLLGVR